MSVSATVVRLIRYPVKGLSPDVLEQCRLEPDQGLPEDRRFAIVHGASTFDPAHPEWKPKTNFLMLARHERLATLETRYDPASLTLTVLRQGRSVAQGRLDEPAGRAVIEQFLAAYMEGAMPGLPRIVEAPGHMFSDAPEKFVSLLNLASVAAVERLAQKPLDPLRFRANLLLEDMPAWGEMTWIGHRLRLGSCRLEVMRGITRCPATSVDPRTGVRDMNLPQILQQQLGHTFCGVYARVLDGGEIAPGMTVSREG